MINNTKELNWNKINENKEECNITIGIMPIGKLIVQKDPIYSNKWMCQFSGFFNNKIFCFDDNTFEFHNIKDKGFAKNIITKQFKKKITEYYNIFLEFKEKYM